MPSAWGPGRAVGVTRLLSSPVVRDELRALWGKHDGDPPAALRDARVRQPPGLGKGAGARAALGGPAGG